MNILFTSVGRRGYLLEYFREALLGRGEVHAANSSSEAPAFYSADKTVITPLIYSEDYIDFIFDYCLSEDIRAIIPLFDIDIPILAAQNDRFSEAGIKLIVPPLDKAIICNDKLKTTNFLRERGYLTPDTFVSLDSVYEAIDRKEINFPLIIKPRWGMGSIGVQRAFNLDELRIMFSIVCREVFTTYLKYESATDIDEAVIVQNMLPGQEFGLDVVNDLDGKYIATFVKRKVAMRSGETDIAKIENNKDLIDLGEKISGDIGHLGNLDIDVFKDGDQIYILELNARFGGGYPFSHLAGADVPRAIVSWLMGESIKSDWLTVTDKTLGFKDIKIREVCEKNIA